MSQQFCHKYVQSKVGKSMFHFIHQISYLRTIHFLFNQLYFQMRFQYLFFFQKYPNNVSKRLKFCNFWNRSSYRNDCFWILELFSIIYQAHFERSSVHNAFSCVLISGRFNDVISLNNMAFNMFIHHFY